MLRAIARVRNKRSQQKGTHGESIARWALQQYGVMQVVRIETGWKVKRAGIRIVSAWPIEKVTADWRGVLRGGQSVMAEAKERDDKLIWSDLQAHQHTALREHHDCGGMSLVVVIFHNERVVGIIRYPHPMFLKGGDGITPASAMDICTWMRIYP